MPQKPIPYSARDNLVSFVQSEAVPSDTVYQPFRGFLVQVTGAISIMDWNGNINVIASATALVTGNPVWISGQQVMMATTATLLLLQ